MGQVQHDDPPVDVLVDHHRRHSRGEFGDLASYAAFADFPAVLQDLSVSVGDAVSADEVLGVVRGHGGPALAGVSVFDVYRGAQVGEGRTSLTLHLEFRAPDRTLTDAEVAGWRGAITAALTGELGGELRG